MFVPQDPLSRKICERRGRTFSVLCSTLECDVEEVVTGAAKSCLQIKRLIKKDLPRSNKGPQSLIVEKPVSKPSPKPRLPTNGSGYTLPVNIQFKPSKKMICPKKRYLVG